MATRGNRLSALPHHTTLGPMPTAPPTLHVHPDRLLPPEPHLRDIARRLYDAVRHLPIISPHGHVDAAVLADDLPFDDPASLLVSPDHYVTRLLHAQGVPLSELGVGAGRLDEQQARRAWRHLCTHWAAFRGTAARYWLECQLHEIFGVTTRPSAETADDIYDIVAARLAEDTFRPRALFGQFGIEVLATTDDPCADLGAHATLEADPQWGGRVIPTFRPDRHLEPARPGWGQAVTELGEAAGIDTGDYAGYLAALEARRAHFIEHGATSSDHSHLDVRAESLGTREAARLYAAALAGTATPAEATAFRRHMTMEMARMSVDDGLVMTLHPAVRRNHHAPTSARFGSDTGHDIPVRAEFTRALQPLLERYGTHPNLQLVLFTTDESVYSRELAPLAGFYPSVFVGAPWWFLDAPEAIHRFRSAVTETAGFTRTSGFIDDTRAFCSIPVRHDMSRRLDSGWLARLVADHRLAEDEALETITELVSVNPRRAFRL